MATYNSAYPALAPLASGDADSPAAGIAAGALLNDDDVSAATRQLKRRRELFASDPRRATNQEVQNAFKREFSVLAENATGGPGAPAWAVNLQNQLQNQMGDLQNQLQNQMGDLQNQARNAATYAPNHPIFPVRDAAGNFPADFPADRFALDSLNPAQLGNLLVFYGLPNAPIATRLERLKLHLGIRP